jgi:hypothetical protein
LSLKAIVYAGWLTDPLSTYVFTLTLDAGLLSKKAIFFAGLTVPLSIFLLCSVDCTGVKIRLPLKFGGWPQNTVGEMREKWRHSAGWFSFSGGGEEGALPNLLAGFPSVVGRGGRHGKISF